MKASVQSILICLVALGLAGCLGSAPTTRFYQLESVAAKPATNPGLKSPTVLVRVGEERDATGRRLLILLVGDSARGELTLETVEQRESGRGLSILRDLLHEWRGHLVVRPENAPWKKGVGACFPT